MAEGWRKNRPSRPPYMGDTVKCAECDATTKMPIGGLRIAAGWGVYNLWTPDGDFLATVVGCPEHPAITAAHVLQKELEPVTVGRVDIEPIIGAGVVA